MESEYRKISCSVFNIITIIVLLVGFVLLSFLGHVFFEIGFIIYCISVYKNYKKYCMKEYKKR